ncbi:hypothetical protein HYY74_00525 [Candidatus Woesearchaeota archaeon]|nr:hypothetical protein [Candidatus Woesearchaeota archaeon]
MNFIAKLACSGKYEAIPEDEFLSKAEKAYGMNNRKEERPSPGPAPSYQALTENLDRLAALQDAMERRMRIDSSPLLSTLDSLCTQVAGAFNPAANPKNVDQLFDEQLEAISVLNSSVRSALTYSWKVRDHVTTYRDETVLIRFAEAALRADEIEKESAEVLADYEKADNKLASLRIQEPNFARYYRVRSVLEKRLNYLSSEKAKTDQTIAIRSSELEALTSYEQIIGQAALAMDRLASYVQAVAQHAAMTKPAREWIRENTQRMGAVYSAFAAMSSYLMRGSMEMGEGLKQMAGMEAAANGSRPITAQIGNMLQDYSRQMANADQQQRARFEAKADAARNRYGG